MHHACYVDHQTACCRAVSIGHADVVLGRLYGWRLPRRARCDRAPTWPPLGSPSVTLLRPGVHLAWMLELDGARCAHFAVLA